MAQRFESVDPVGAWEALCDTTKRRVGASFSERLAWTELQYLDAEGTRLSSSVIGVFHQLAYALLVRSGGDPIANWDDAHFVRRQLVEWLLDLSGRPAFWSRVNVGEGSEATYLPELTGEAFLSSIWESLERRLTGEGVASLERDYRLGSRSASWLLKRFEWTSAFRVLRPFYGVSGAFFRVAFRLPLLAGVMVGWLFALEGESVVGYAMSPVLAGSAAELLGRGGLLLLGPLVVSTAYIWAANANDRAQQPMEKALEVVVIGLLTAGLVGTYFVTACGGEWFDFLGLEFGWPRVLFVALWSPVALLIGIVAQVFWAGRGVTDPAWGELS